MNGMLFIDIGLGLGLVYLLLSLIPTAVTELLASLLNRRAVTLRAGIDNMLKGTQLADELYKTSLVRSLYRGTRKPAAIPARLFASALLGLLDKPGARQGISSTVAALSDQSIGGGCLKALLTEAGNDIEKLKEKLAAWFDSAMERVSGWYKRWAQIVSLVVALLIAGVINADTIQIVRFMSADAAARATLSQQAVSVAQGENPPATPSTLDDAREILSDLETFGIPLGWPEVPVGWTQWALKIIGLFITAVAMTLGAPFWFDLLKKVSGLRGNQATAETRAGSA